MDINSFISNVGTGASANRFRVQLLNPVNNIADLKIPFMVKAAQIPAFTLGTIELPYMGRKVKQAGDRTFAPWTVTVMNDERNTVRNAIEHWQSAINGTESNLRNFATSSPAQYKSQAQISMLSVTNKVLRTYNFVGLWPQEISSIDLDWNNSDTIQEFQVTFEYDYWEIVGGDTGVGGTNL